MSGDTAVLYAHVADDGGVLVIDGESGRSAWVPLSEFVRRLQVLQKTGGSLLLSQERGSPSAAPVFEAIRRAGVPTTPSPQIHSDAIRAGGSTALMSAAYVGAEELARDLVDRGADLEARDEEGFTALMYAANAGQDRLARLLIEAGA